MKTLGQIANEAFDSGIGRTFSESWEAAAQAVREAVIEECARIWSDPENEHAKMIRALKDKK